MKNTQQPSGMPIHKYRPVPRADRRRPARPHLARQAHHRGPALVRRRPARRQPGPHRPDEPRAQAHHVRPARAAWATRRSRSASRRRSQTDFDFVRQLIEEGADPRRRHHPGADPGARAPDRAHLRVDRRRQAGDRAPVQLDEHPAARRRVPHRQAGHHRHRPRRARGCASSTRRRSPSTKVYYEYSPESYTGTELEFARRRSATR